MNIVILLAAGSSTRLRAHIKPAKDKLFLPVLGKPLLYYALQTLYDHPQVHRVIIVAGASNQKNIRSLIKKFHFPRAEIILGGKERQYSVEKGLLSIKNAEPTDVMIIHNGANPLVTAKEISAIISATKKYKAAAVGRKMIDTIKEIHKGHIVKTHDRTKLLAMQTPQAAQYSILKKAFQKAKKQRKLFTDDTALIENLKQKVRHLPASADNFKVTTFHDYERVKIIMGDTPQNFLVGIGQDSHAFSATRKGLKIGGILLKNAPKLHADSDGDVLLHALYNAISQALGEGSLGRFATPLYKEKGITGSKNYLQPLLLHLRKQKYQLNNLGLMIEAQRPPIDPLAAKIKKSLSAITGLPQARIGITATSGKKLTPFGRGEAIQCFAIVSLKKHEHAPPWRGHK